MRTLALIIALSSATLLSGQEHPPRSLEQKMQRFQQSAERWHRVSQFMGEFHLLMREGEFDRAEALVDRALRILETGTEPQDAARIRKFQRRTDETHYIILPVPEAGFLH
ncbi:MAG: hypothetical protein VXZ38_03145 [Planctomycetota bacterium]|nr:hypothetical protein [Planctomycetota bacterium]